jgi:hypothetical protein
MDVLFSIRLRLTPRSRSVRLCAPGFASSRSSAFCRRVAPCARSEFTGDPGLVNLDPRWHQAALHFVRLGFVHILSGADHLLFLLCLILPLRRIKRCVVTAFTAAHSLTLMAAASNGAGRTVVSPLVETLIAASIVHSSRTSS